MNFGTASGTKNTTEFRALSHPQIRLALRARNRQRINFIKDNEPMHFAIFANNRSQDHFTAVGTSGPEDPTRAQPSHFAF
jgi:hypothetical protein